MPAAENVGLTPKRAEETLARAFHFLPAVGTCAAIRRSLMTVGYRADDHREGWARFDRAMGRDASFEATTLALPADDGVGAVLAWTRRAVALALPSMRRWFPEEEQFLLYLRGLPPEDATKAAGLL